MLGRPVLKLRLLIISRRLGKLYGPRTYKRILKIFFFCPSLLSFFLGVDYVGIILLSTRGVGLPAVIERFQAFNLIDKFASSTSSIQPKHQQFPLGNFHRLTQKRITVRNHNERKGSRVQGERTLQQSANKHKTKPKKSKQQQQQKKKLFEGRVETAINEEFIASRLTRSGSSCFCIDD